MVLTVVHLFTLYSHTTGMSNLEIILGMVPVSAEMFEIALGRIDVKSVRTYSDMQIVSYVFLKYISGSSEISPTRCNNCVFILRNGFTLHVSGDNLTHHQEYICCIWQ